MIIWGLGILFAAGIIDTAFKNAYVLPLAKKVDELEERLNDLNLQERLNTIEDDIEEIENRLD